MLQSENLRAAYRRRACYTTVLTAAAFSATLTHLPTVGAQDAAPDTATTKPQNARNSRQKANQPPPMRVVPMPRAQRGQAAGTSQAGGASGGSQPPTTPAPGGGRGGNGQGRRGRGNRGGTNPFNPNMPNSGPPITTLPGGGIPGARAVSGGGGPTFSFDFRGSDINNVLKFYSQMSGLTVSADPGLAGQVTIINPKPVSLDEAFKVLQQVLLVRGFSATQNGDVLSILPFDRAATNTPILNPGLNEEGGTRVDSRNQVMTQVIPLENVDAEQLAKELKELTNKGASLIGSPGTNALIITDTASNVERFIRLVEALDKTSNKSELRTYPLRRAEATSVADIINNLFKQITTRGRGAGAPAPGQPGFNPGGGQPGGAQQPAGRPAVIAVADQRTNSVIVVASPDQQEKIASDIINRLDDDDTNTLTTKIRKINFADAATVASLVNSVLSNQRGGASSTAPPSFAARAFGFTDPSSQQNVASTDPFGKLVPDQRTNSVLISANTERMKQIDELIDQLDREVPFEPTTFVFPLRNAQAEDVAYALGQAFQTNQNNNNNFGGFFGFGGFGGGNGSNNQRQPINRRLQSNSNRAFRTRGVPPGPPNAPDDSNQGDGTGGGANGGSAMPSGVPGVMTDQGFVPTEGAGNGETDTSGSPKTRQFFGFGGRQRSLGQVQGPQFGRGRTGTYSNLLQLQNNVFVTPSPGGDSIIVTTTPDNYEAVRQIIEALDVVPRQVMIEVIVAEVSLDSSQKLGFNLNGLIKNAFASRNNIQTQYNGNVSGFNSGTTSSAVDTLASGAQAALTGVNYNLLLQALQQDNKVRILSTPRVFTSNNQQADIEITQRVPYITGQTSNGFVNTTVSNQVEFLNVGVTMRVTPRITRQGLVTIDVVSEASELLRFQTLGTGVAALTAPVTNDRYTDTSVTIQDGETAVLGGLIRENKATNINKFPLLGEIPIIGQFFRSREITRSKVELVIFMTPHVVSTVEDIRQLTRKEGRPVIRQIPELPQQQPNLDLRGFDANGKPLPPKPDAKQKQEQKADQKQETPPVSQP